MCASNVYNVPPYSIWLNTEDGSYDSGKFTVFFTGNQICPDNFNTFGEAKKFLDGLLTQKIQELRVITLRGRFMDEESPPVEATIVKIYPKPVYNGGYNEGVLSYIDACGRKQTAEFQLGFIYKATPKNLAIMNEIHLTRALKKQIEDKIDTLLKSFEAPIKDGGWLRNFIEEKKEDDN